MKWKFNCYQYTKLNGDTSPKNIKILNILFTEHEMLDYNLVYLLVAHLTTLPAAQII